MRQFLLFISIIAVGILFLSRLFYLQIYDSHNYSLFEDNAIRKVYDYPKRGFVYDRNGALLVANQPSYDVMVVPREVEPLDTLEFCALLKIDKAQFIKKYNKARSYKMGDLKGKNGVEASYENILRGKKGIKFIQKDRFNRNIGPYKDGTLDTIPEQGKDITITIDAQLQAYGELLMQNKRGGIIAIEPATGEILTMVAAPTYDPNMLVGRDRSSNYTKLLRDTIAKPLFNRSRLHLKKR